MTIDYWIDYRADSREEKDYDTCDIIRDYLDSKGVFIFDTKDGQTIYYHPKQKTRKELEKRLQDDIRSEKQFDAWLVTQKSKNLAIVNDTDYPLRSKDSSE